MAGSAHEQKIRFRVELYRPLVTVWGLIVVFVDSAFFYLAVAEMSWGSAFSFKASS